MPNSRSGILLVDKPEGVSSAHVLNQLKHKHGFLRIGHGGTLDPFATGLLVALVGEGTKVARFLLEGEKAYEAEAVLGSATNTGDLTGEIVETSAVPSFSLEEWQALAQKFTGRIQQTPPAFSAIKVKGKALYQYAREGKTVEVKSREVQVKEFTILGVENNSLRFRVSCSGGTYVRVLAADLAKAAGSSAHLKSLRRLQSSSFRVEDAEPLTKLLEMPTEQVPLRSVSEALSHLCQVECNNDQASKVRNGNLAVFDSLRSQMEKPGYFLVVHEGKPVAVCNHHPMLVPFCSIERVFDPRLLET